MILFATGNGSITNFPFVPTIKIMTTTRRFELVRNEMDFNAGRYLDGESLEDLGKEAFDYLINIASGRPSAGERAGHSQVQLWREWRGDNTSQTRVKPVISSKPVLLKRDVQRPPLDETLELLAPEKERDGVALVLPTSLCSGQISLMIAQQLAKAIAKQELNLKRAVALPHTEGCGNSAGESEELFMRTMAGYLTHPLVSKALLLEHGCEKTHNDAFRSILRGFEIPDTSLGWASVQLDGGIERVIRKALKWFETSEAGKRAEIPLGIALVGRNIPKNIRNAFELLGNAILYRDGAAVIPHQSELWKKRNRIDVSLDYGQRYESPGLHSMFCPTEDAVEIVTGLGATGVRWIIGYEENSLLAGNPLVPTIQVSNKERKDVDLVANEDDEPRSIAENLLKLMIDIKTGKNLPSSEMLENTGFQITRGWTGISL